MILLLINILLSISILKWLEVLLIVVQAGDDGKPPDWADRTSQTLRSWEHSTYGDDNDDDDDNGDDDGNGDEGLMVVVMVVWGINWVTH